MNSLDNMKIKKIDIILIDIEGFEYNFLVGGQKTILKYKPIIIIEIWDNKKRKNENMNTTREQIIDMILLLGYKLANTINDDHIFEPL